MSKYRSFKGTERAIAKAIGGTRTGHLGRADVTHNWLSVECKHRKELPAWLGDALDQSKRHAKESQLPVVVLHQHGDRHSNDVVMLRFSDWLDWFGDIQLSLELPPCEVPATQPST